MGLPALISMAMPLAFVFFLCAPMAAQVVAVPEPVAGGASVTALNKLQVRGAIEDFLTRSRDYRVVDRARTDLVMAELRLQREGGPMDPGEAKEAGRHLGADFVCASEIHKDEGYTVINIALINVETGVVAKSGSETVPGGSPAAIRGATERIASRLTGVLTEEQQTAKKRLREKVAFGMYAGAILPTGRFGGVDHPPTLDVKVAQTEGYDPGLGCRFTVTVPAFSGRAGLRAVAGVTRNSGSNTAPGLPDIELRHTAIGAGGELQVFFGEPYMHRGTYVFGGAAMEHETFRRGGDGQGGGPSHHRTVRLGGAVGYGHTFAGGCTIELAYHATLSARGSRPSDAVAADHLRLAFGFVF